MFDGRNLRKKLSQKRNCIGTWTHTTDACDIEVMCGCGFDFMIIDGEHGAYTIETIQRIVMATKGSDTAILVRVPWNDPVIIKPVLDTGPDGIVVPMVNTAEQAKQAVSACLYPPLGVRGWGPRRPSNYQRTRTEDYIAQAHENLVIFTQVEHYLAVENVKEIIRTPRLDGIVIGSMDLSFSLGVPGQSSDPKMENAVATTIAACNEVGMPVGMVLGGDPKVAFNWIQRGCQFVTLSSTAGFMASGAANASSELRGLL